MIVCRRRLFPALRGREWVRDRGRGKGRGRGRVGGRPKAVRDTRVTGLNGGRAALGVELLDLPTLHVPGLKAAMMIMERICSVSKIVWESYWWVTSNDLRM